MARSGVRTLAFGIVTMASFAGSGSAQSLPVYQPSPASQPLPASQSFAAAQSAQEAPLLTPQQLDNLVAPIALYPDQMLSQILAASTYPLELVDAEQWMQQNKNLPPAQMVNAARQQNWDPSVQALVAFPDVLDILSRDIHWTTDLGNAFLAQQADVMGAIQQMRGRAQQSGQLRSTPQQTVSTQYENGQSAIQIAPTDPQTVYVPEYQPSAVWGPPTYGAYPSLWYPPSWGAYGGYGGGYAGGYGYGSGYGGGIGFSPGVFLGNLFSGLMNFGPWGWGLNWFSHALFLIPSFFAHFFGGWWGGHGYGGSYYAGGFVGGHPLWAHDPVHRLGVPYANRAVAAHFGASFGTRGAVAANRGFAGAGFRAEAPRAAGGGAWRGVGNGGFSGESRAPAGNQFAARTAPQAAGRSFGGESFAGNNFRGGEQGFRQEAPRQEASRSRQPQAMARNFSAPRASERQSFSAPSSRGSASAQHFSQPHASAPHASAPRASNGGSHGGGGGHSSGGHSGGGHSGGHRG
jgi:Protein of unknown function (DUF3300)